MAPGFLFSLIVAVYDKDESKKKTTTTSRLEENNDDQTFKCVSSLEKSSNEIRFTIFIFMKNLHRKCCDNAISNFSGRQSLNRLLIGFNWFCWISHKDRRLSFVQYEKWAIKMLN